MESLVLLQEKFSIFLDETLAPETSEIGDKTDFKSKIQFYLAQCPISSCDPHSSELQPGPLSALLQDFNIPSPLRTHKTHNYTDFTLNQINFWANIHSPATSSLHYDPYSNLLCVVTGQKTVRLLPPCGTKHLQNVSNAYAESSNHADDDLGFHFPQRKEEINQMSNGQLSEFILNPGDALFLPEGWWHQVSSTAGTTAINFWWGTSHASSSYSTNYNDYTPEDREIMADYYDRCRVKLLIEDQKIALLHKACSQAHELYPINFNQHDEVDLETPLNLEERQFMMQLKQILEEIDEKKEETKKKALFEAIELRILALLYSGPLQFIRIIKALRREYPGMVAVLLMEVDSRKIWEALTSGLENQISEKVSIADSINEDEDISMIDTTAVSWVEKSGGVENVLSTFFDELYSDKGCDRKVIAERMVRLKNEFAKEAYETTGL